MSKEETTILPQENTPIEDVGDQYLTFRLAGEDYGIDILRVQEIRGWEEVTRLPNTPAFVCGVVNLRGTIVPVFDLRLKFNLPFRPYTPNTVVIVIRTLTRGTSKHVGIVVDAVADVLHGYLIEITKSPDFGNAALTDAISGLATFENKMVVLLDVDRLVSDETGSGAEDDPDETTQHTD